MGLGTSQGACGLAADFDPKPALKTKSKNEEELVDWRECSHISWLGDGVP